MLGSSLRASSHLGARCLLAKQFTASLSKSKLSSVGLKHLAASRRPVVISPGLEWTRGYAAHAPNNKGMVCYILFSLFIEKWNNNLGSETNFGLVVGRMQTTHSYKGMLQIISMRCTWHGGVTPKVYTSHGRFTSEI